MLFAADMVGEELRNNGFNAADSRTALVADAIVDRMRRLPLLPQRSRDIALADEAGAEWAVTGSWYVMSDSIWATAQITNTRKRDLSRQFSLAAPRSEGSALVDSLRVRTLLEVARLLDQRPSAQTVGLVPTRSLEAYELTNGAWLRFFDDTQDTAVVFDMFNRAERADPNYLAPKLLRAYVLDVKQMWPETERLVSDLRQYESRLRPVEKAALEMYAADLQGNTLRRLELARTLARLSPGSTEMRLLVVLSALYCGRSADAVAAMAEADPDRGMNLVSPVYWEWRAFSQHAHGDYAAEKKSVGIGRNRFEHKPAMTHAWIRTLATNGDVSQIRKFFGSKDGKMLDARRRRSLQLMAARELRTHGYPAGAAALFADLRAELGEPSLTSPPEALRFHAEVLHESGEHAAARPLFAELLRSDSLDIHALGRLGSIAARLNDRAAASAFSERLAALGTPYLMGENTAWRAHISSAGGNTAEAAELLEKAVREGYRIMDLRPLLPHDDGDFAALRVSTHYAALLHRLSGPALTMR
jgi:tetratricopeptide (TPR) repeat protein